MEPTAQPITPANATTQLGSRDGVGAGDHDQPYRFGHRPRADWPSPFSTIQYARLLGLRGRVLDGEFADDTRKA